MREQSPQDPVTSHVLHGREQQAPVSVVPLQRHGGCVLAETTDPNLSSPVPQDTAQIEFTSCTLARIFQNGVVHLLLPRRAVE